MTHLGYILAAYGAAFMVLGGLTAWVVTDLRTQMRRLKALEGQGLGRRPERSVR